MTRPRKQEHGKTPTRSDEGPAAERPGNDGVSAGAPDVAPDVAPDAESDVVRDAPGPQAGLELEAEAPAAEPTLEQTLRRERDEFQEKWLRALAELDNVRKRSRREAADARRLAQVELLRPFLDVHDNMVRALQSLRGAPEPGGTDGVLQGVELIFQRLQGVLRDSGVVPIEALGREFDPVFHDAVAQIPREGVAAGQVIEVVQEGFMLGEMVLRPARVVISS